MRSDPQLPKHVDVADQRFLRTYLSQAYFACLDALCKIAFSACARSQLIRSAITDIYNVGRHASETCAGPVSVRQQKSSSAVPCSRVSEDSVPGHHM